MVPSIAMLLIIQLKQSEFQGRGCQGGVMVKAMDCGIVVSDSEIQSLSDKYPGKGMKPLIFQFMG